MPFEWTVETQTAFDSLKEHLSKSLLLAYPDFSLSFMLETDALGKGPGAVLAQKQKDGMLHPVAYATRSLHSHEKNYGISELEGLGVVWAIRHYLYGHKCDVYSDHEALKSLINTPSPFW